MVLKLEMGEGEFVKKIWPFSFYFLFFAAIASIAPYIVLYYRSLQFNGAQIGLLSGVPPLITLVFAPLLTGVADSTQKHRLIMGVGIAAFFMVAAILPSLTNFALVFVMIVLLYIFFAPIGPLADSATMSMLGDEKAMYGRIRMGGTIGWGIFALIAGWMLDVYGLRSLFYLSAALMLINLFVGQKLSFSRPEEISTNDGGMRILLANRLWIFFLLFSFLGGVGTITEEIYLSPYMMEIGARGNHIGVALIIATITEFLIFFVGDRLVERYGAYRLFMISLVLVGLRSLFLVAATTVFLVYIIQALSGAIFAAMWVSGVAYADEHAPANLKSTGQGLFNAMTFGFGAAVGGFIGGIFLDRIGGKGMFLVMGIVILIGLLVIEGFKRILLMPNEEGPEII